MDEAHSYEALYLYNAVIEYVYFLIALIETEGPRRLVDVEKHLKFFNHDIYDFAQMFDGEDLSEKIGTMLCTTSKVFKIQERILNLSSNYEHFRRAIYKDLLISKLFDCVLRGMYFIKDICHNINLNNMIRIEEKSFIAVLKKYPYFHLDSNNTVTIVQFHGLKGFEDHAYKTVLQYFQSSLQNIKSLTYNEITFHEKFIPSCAISNPLFLFCTLHVCSIFKCKKGKVKLRKKFRKRKCGNQLINIKELSFSKSVPIGLLVSKALGRTLYSWTGEISELTKSTGFIQCVVNFTNEYQGIFVIYLYKTALKYICEIEDLKDYLSIRDIVEFDAIYCDESFDQRIFWQATSIKVIKQSLKKNKFELDVNVERYLEKIKQKSNSFNVTSKTCSLRNCNADFFILEKKLSVTLLNKANPKPPLGLDVKLLSNCQNSTLGKASNLCHNSSDSLRNKESTNMPLMDSKKENLSDLKNVQDANSAVKTDSNENNVLISDTLFLRSSFMFGEISVTSEKDGMVITTNTFNQHYVFFNCEAIFHENKKIPAKGSKVLLFIPYVELEDSFYVATLVYPLNSEESVLFNDESVSIVHFVMNNFLPTVKKSLNGISPCFCSLIHILTHILLISQKPETENSYNYTNFIKSLHDLFCFSKKTSKQLYMLIKELHSRNLSFSYKKLCANVVLLFMKAFSLTNCSKKVTVLRKGRKTLKNYSCKQKYIGSNSETNTMPVCSEIPDIVICEFKKERNRSDNKEEILVKSKDYCVTEKQDDAIFEANLLQVEPFVKDGLRNCYSISSDSCNSKSSDDVYFSCESLPELFDSISDNNENSLPSQSITTNLYKENDHKIASADCNKMKDLQSLTEQSTKLISEEISIPKNRSNKLDKTYSKKFEVSYFSDFKLRHSSLSKAKNRLNKHRVVLPSTSNHCKECCKSVVETIGNISIMTKSCLYFYTAYNQQNATLRIPKYLVSGEILKRLTLGSTIKIGIIPNALLHFSDVLYINLH